MQVRTSDTLQEENIRKRQHFFFLVKKTFIYTSFQMVAVWLECMKLAGKQKQLILFFIFWPRQAF